MNRVKKLLKNLSRAQLFILRKLFIIVCNLIYAGKNYATVGFQLNRTENRNSAFVNIEHDCCWIQLNSKHRPCLKPAYAPLLLKLWNPGFDIAGKLPSQELTSAKMKKKIVKETTAPITTTQ